MTLIYTDLAPKPIGPYSQAIEHQGVIYVSGQIGIDPKTGKLISEVFIDQAVQIFNNLENILAKAESDLSHVLRIDVFVKDLNLFNELNQLFEQKFVKGIKPVRQTVEVSDLPMDAMVEISLIAAKKNFN